MDTLSSVQEGLNAFWSENFFCSLYGVMEVALIDKQWMTVLYFAVVGPISKAERHLKHIQAHTLKYQQVESMSVSKAYNSWIK